MGDLFKRMDEIVACIDYNIQQIKYIDFILYMYARNVIFNVKCIQ